MGYPPDFQIPVSDTQAYRQFGNSVVVPVVQKIATAVIETLRRPFGQPADLFLKLSDKPDRHKSTGPTANVSYLKAKRTSRKPPSKKP